MTPLSPGVYVLEVPGGPRAIEGALTAVTIFVGETERGPSQPTAVRSRLEYERIFGGYFRHRVANPGAATGGASDLSKLFMPYAMDGFFGNGGPRAYVLRTLSPGGGVATASAEFSDGTNTIHIDAASPGAWGNFIKVEARDSGDGDTARFAIVVAYQAPGESAAKEVEVFDALSFEAADEKYCVDALARSGFIRWRTSDVAIARLQIKAATSLQNGEGGQGSIAAGDYSSFLSALREIDDAALIVAASDQMLPGSGASANDYVTISNAFVDYVAHQRPQLDLFFVGDLPRFASESDPAGAVVARARGTVAPGSTPSNFCAIYWPHIVVSDPVGQGANPRIVLPPAGHIAGLYGTTDGRRGVWKAPAGVDVRIAGALMLDFKVLDVDQDVFNPLGINALRAIPNAGNVIWGTRTREPTTEWRYIPVRRTAMFLRKSIYNGIQWAVFEPNAQPLWTSLRATISAFMETQFHNGAFAGETSRDAYFVKCDADTTTEADQTQGIVNILVGFAPLRPAEFVIVKLSQKTRQAA